MNIFWNKYRWAYNRSIQKRSKTRHTAQYNSMILKACQVSMSCHARFCSRFSPMVSSACIINTWTGWNCILLAYGPSPPKVRMDITRQCNLWGLLGKVVCVIVLVFKEGRKQLESQDRNKSLCTVWGKDCQYQTYTILSSTAWQKVLMNHWGLCIYLTVFWINSYRAARTPRPDYYHYRFHGNLLPIPHIQSTQ